MCWFKVLRDLKNALALPFGIIIFTQKNQDTVKIVPIENNNGEVVTPSDETVQTALLNPI